MSRKVRSEVANQALFVAQQGAQGGHRLGVCAYGLHVRSNEDLMRTAHEEDLQDLTRTWHCGPEPQKQRSFGPTDPMPGLHQAHRQFRVQVRSGFRLQVP